VAEAVQYDAEPAGVEHAIFACRYVLRCRAAGDRRTTMLLLRDIVSFYDAVRIYDAMTETYGAAFMATVARPAERRQ
jgi:hypothetical protein